MAWRGDSKGHAEAGRKGGKNQGKHNNPGNFANNPQRAREAGKKGGISKPSKKTETPPVSQLTPENETPTPALEQTAVQKNEPSRVSLSR